MDEMEPFKSFWSVADVLAHTVRQEMASKGPGMKPRRAERVLVFTYMNIQERGCGARLGEVITALFICVVDMRSTRTLLHYSHRPVKP